MPLKQLVPGSIPEDVNARKGNKGIWSKLAGISIAQVEIPVGKWRAPHYHTNTPEIAVITSGTASAGLITPENKLIVINLQAGDCVFFPLGYPHWLRNIGTTALQAYFNYGHEQPVTFEVANLALQVSTAGDGLALKGRAEYTHTE